MEMRTGKTLTSLDGMKKGEAWPLLIICPKDLIDRTWLPALHQDGADPECIQVVEGSRVQKEKALMYPKAINLANYDILKNYDILRAQDWAGIIFDESIRIANMTSAVTQYCMDWAQDTSNQDRMITLLSGSPASEGPIQLISQLFICTGSICGHRDWEKYFLSNWKYNRYKYRWEPKNKAVVEELRGFSERNAYIKTAKDVGADFEYQMERWEIPQSKWVSKRLEKLYKDEIYGEGSIYTPLVKANHELQICCGLEPETKEIKCNSKYEAVRDAILEWKEPVLIVSMLREGVIEHLNEVLSKAGIRTGVMVGQNRDQNSEVYDKWVKGELDVVIGQIKVVKMGSDFSRASRIVYFSLSYSQDDRSQSLARCSNMEKRGMPTQVVDAAVKGSLEYDMVDELNQKRDVSQSFMENRYADKSRK